MSTGGNKITIYYKICIQLSVRKIQIKYKNIKFLIFIRNLYRKTQMKNYGNNKGQHRQRDKRENRKEIHRLPEIRADDYPDAAGGLPADKRGGVGAAEEAERMHHVLQGGAGGGIERVLEAGGKGGRTNRVQPVYEREHAGVFGTGMD